ncbi:MAG: hypothetical protein IJ809_03910 [Clostridia bacterium]|nr:hypothetical protein [Clostridia bacterium]
MNISKIGSMHVEKMYSNQDYFYAEDKFKLVCDGCSAGKDSDFGTRLFIKKFAMLPDYLDESKFEENARKVFEELLDFFSINTLDKMEKKDYDFVITNMLFTILACFEKEDSFVVKFLGDGYIITENFLRKISYIKIDYGPCPPYLAYNYILPKYKESFKEELMFKTYEFPKKLFLRVGLGTDGIEPIVFSNKLSKEDKFKFDSFLLNLSGVPVQRNINQVVNMINRNSNNFYDDTTIVF